MNPKSKKDLVAILSFLTCTLLITSLSLAQNGTPKSKSEETNRNPSNDRLSDDKKPSDSLDGIVRNPNPNKSQRTQEQFAQESQDSPEATSSPDNSGSRFFDFTSIILYILLAIGVFFFIRYTFFGRKSKDYTPHPLPKGIPKFKPKSNSYQSPRMHEGDVDNANHRDFEPIANPHPRYPSDDLQVLVSKISEIKEILNSLVRDGIITDKRRPSDTNRREGDGSGLVATAINRINRIDEKFDQQREEVNRSLNKFLQELKTQKDLQPEPANPSRQKETAYSKSSSASKPSEVSVSPNESAYIYLQRHAKEIAKHWEEMTNRLQAPDGGGYLQFFYEDPGAENSKEWDEDHTKDEARRFAPGAVIRVIQPRIIWNRTNNKSEPLSQGKLLRAE